MTTSYNEDEMNGLGKYLTTFKSLSNAWQNSWATTAFNNREPITTWPQNDHSGP